MDNFKVYWFAALGLLAVLGGGYLLRVDHEAQLRRDEERLQHICPQSLRPTN